MQKYINWKYQNGYIAIGLPTPSFDRIKLERFLPDGLKSKFDILYFNGNTCKVTFHC
jgi:hypothetical protein